MIRLLLPALEAAESNLLADDSSDAVMLEVLRWVEKHAHERIDVETIAAYANLTPRTLHRQFSRAFGFPPSVWLIYARVRRAQVMLADTDWPIVKISRESGLGTDANLRYRFHSVTGMSPSRYRAAVRRARE